MGRQLFSYCYTTYPEVSKEAFSDISSNIVIKDSLDSDSQCYLPVKFAVYIRTDKGNLVLVNNEGNFAEILDAPDSMLSGGVYPTISYDAGIMCAKSFLDSAFTFKTNEALQRLVLNSTCFPVGAFAINDSYILVFNVILSQSLLFDPEISLNSGFSFIPIQTVCGIKDRCQSEISKTLVLVTE